MEAQEEVIAMEDESMFVRPGRGELIKVGVLGAVVGLIIPALSFLLAQFFIEPVFCRSGGATGICGGSDLLAYYIVSGIMSLVAVALLANWQVFRPLLIAVAAAAAMWGLSRYMQHLIGSNGAEYYALSAALYGLAYLLFYWTMRVRNFVLSVIATALIVVAIRWALIS